MANKFHINKHGVPAPCRATKGNCPLGGESGNENHFDNLEDAQARANELNEGEFGLLPGGHNSSYRKVNGENDERHVARRFNALRLRDERKRRSTRGRSGNYMGRCKDAEEIPDYSVNNEKTAHYKNDRTAKERRLTETFGKGEVLGHYRVNHIVSDDDGEDIYADQVVEIRDNGRIAIYDYEDGRKVTTFMAHEERVEVMMLHSGQIPSEQFLKDVKNNFKDESRYQSAERRRRREAAQAAELALQ